MEGDFAQHCRDIVHNYYNTSLSEATTTRAQCGAFVHGGALQQALVLQV